MCNKARSEDLPTYGLPPVDQRRPSGLTIAEQDSTIAQALDILTVRLAQPGAVLQNPTDTKNYLVLMLAGLEHEVFACLWLDSQHRVLHCDEMFRGTLSQTSVYPREVVKAALKRNAGAVIFAHNHPSGIPQPSMADELLTKSLKDTLALVEVKVLDHIIVGGMSTMSFAEQGLI